MSNYPNNQPSNNYQPQLEAQVWHLSPQGSIAVVVCLPIAAGLLFALGCRLGYMYRKNKYLTLPAGTTPCMWNANEGRFDPQWED